MMRSILNALPYTRKMHRKDSTRKEYPITDVPFYPESKNSVVQYKHLEFQEDYFPVTLALGRNDANLVRPESLGMIQANLLNMYSNFSKLPSEIREPLPRNTIAIFFALENFQVGCDWQRFFPSDKIKAPKDAYTYQMLSKNVQATYYNENGVQFLAGFGYYPVSINEPLCYKIDEAMMFLAHCSTVLYPLEDTQKLYNINGKRFYGRNCKTAGKRILVLNGHGHFEYDHFSEMFTSTPCNECELTYYLTEMTKDELIAVESPKSSNSRNTSKTSIPVNYSKLLREPCTVRLLDDYDKNEGTSE